MYREYTKKLEEEYFELEPMSHYSFNSMFNKNYSGVKKLKSYSDFCQVCWDYYTNILGSTCDEQVSELRISWDEHKKLAKDAQFIYKECHVKMAQELKDKQICVISADYAQ